MKSWHVLLIGMAAGVACVLIAKKLLGQSSGTGGMGAGFDVPPPNPRRTRSSRRTPRSSKKRPNRTKRSSRR